MKKRIGIVSYNIYCNFTNYGSALQSWALCQSIKKIAGNIVEPVLVDYCPEILADKDPLNPFANMWDKDEESRRMCELTLPAIRENYYKFDRFYHERFTRSSKKYTAQNFNEICTDEDISGFVGYIATFPLLLNIAGEPTYFIPLKDNTNLVKSYAMVNEIGRAHV